MTNKSEYCVVYICAGFSEKKFFCGEFSNRDKVGVVVPSGDSIYGNTVGDMPSTYFLHFPFQSYQRSHQVLTVNNHSV